MIEYPFPAVGLLLENASNCGNPVSTFLGGTVPINEFCVEYPVNMAQKNSKIPGADPFLIIYENNYLAYTYEELANSIANFEYFLSYYSLMPMDRKARAAMQR